MAFRGKMDDRAWPIRGKQLPQEGGIADIAMNKGVAFIAIQRRLDGEPLEEYIKPFGGGFYFVLPGVPGPGHYLGQSLIEAA